MAQTITLTIAEALKIALEHHQAGRLHEAEAIYQQILQLQPNHPQVLDYRGVLAHQMGRHSLAIELIRHALTIHPDLPHLYSNLGANHAALGELEEAITAYRQALAIQPDHLNGLTNLALALKKQSRWEEAAIAYRQALALQPGAARLHNELGETLLARGQISEAITAHQQALLHQPDFPEALLCLGNALKAQGEPEQAIPLYQRAIQLRPLYPEAHYNLGLTQQEIGKPVEAEAAYRQALLLKPEFPQAHYGLATLLHEQGQSDEALHHYRQALELNPDYAMAHDTLGSLFQERRALPEALACFQNAHRLAPDNATYLSKLIHIHHQLCDWENVRPLEERLRAMIRAGNHEAVPFMLVAFSTAPEEQRACAEENIGKRIPPHPPLAAPTPRTRGGERLKIGYISADWQDHPVALLLSEVLELHDRQRFEIKIYSYGVDDGRPTRQRIIAACDTFTDIRHLSPKEAAQQIRDDQVDLLVELMGYTAGTRLEILAWKPAPIQATWLGYLGTVGAPYIDYLIADAFVTPPGSESGYREKLLRLPECFQPNDRHCAIAERTPTRHECGLPATGFVFASFNQTFKITPEIFDLWMELLRALPEAVLWLMESNRWVAENLRRAAERRNIAGSRLVFASFLPQPHHLARYRLVDLALDTQPCTSGTTGSNALWAGCPMVSYAGKTFPSRVAGSLLVNAALPELVTHSLEEYAALALELARQPARLRALRRRLQKNIATAPLFDTPRFTQTLEKGYEAIWQRHQAGLPPDHIDLKPLPRTPNRGKRPNHSEKL